MTTNLSTNASSKPSKKTNENDFMIVKDLLDIDVNNFRFEQKASCCGCPQNDIFTNC